MGHIPWNAGEGGRGSEGCHKSGTRCREPCGGAAVNSWAFHVSPELWEGAGLSPFPVAPQSLSKAILSLNHCGLCSRAGHIVGVSFPSVPPSPPINSCLSWSCARGAASVWIQRFGGGAGWAVVCSGSGADLPPVPCPVSTWKISWLRVMGRVWVGDRGRRIPKDGQEVSPPSAAPLPQVKNPIGFSCGEDIPTQILDGVEEGLFLGSEDIPGTAPSVQLLGVGGIPWWNSPE